jgi:hypothetical protein
MHKLIFIYLLIFFRHPLHLGVTEIAVQKNTSALEISHKLFYDDVENALEKQYKVKLFLNTPKESPKVAEYLQKYIANRFLIRCNGVLQDLQYVGYEYEEEAIWIYYEMPKPTKNGNLQITNRLLMELHNDQNNFLHLQQQEKRQSLRFTFDAQTQEIIF